MHPEIAAMAALLLVAAGLIATWALGRAAKPAPVGGLTIIAGETVRPFEGGFLKTEAGDDRSVVFEDDGASGFLHALVRPAAGEMEVADAMLIYDAGSLGDPERARHVEIGWTRDGRYAALRRASLIGSTRPAGWRGRRRTRDVPEPAHRGGLSARSYN